MGNPQPGRIPKWSSAEIAHGDYAAALRAAYGRVAFLSDLAAGLLAAREPLEFMAGAYERLKDLAGLDVSLHFTNEGAHMALAACHGIDGEAAAALARISISEGVCGAAAAERRPISITAVQRRTDEMTAFVRRLGIRAYACFPLICSGRLIGTLSFGSRTRDAFHPDDFLLLRSVADAVATALERKSADDALRLRETTLNAFFEASPGILILLDERLRFVKAGERTQAYFGVAADALEGSLLQDCAPEFAAAYGPMMRRVMATGRPEMNVELRTPGAGEVLNWRVSCFPVCLPDGVRGLGIMGVDVTDIKRAEERASIAQERLEAAQRAAGIGSWETDVATGNIWWSPETYSIYGIPQGTPITVEAFYATVHPEDLPRVREHAARVREGAGAYEVEHRVLRPDGTERHVREFATMVFSERLGTARLVGIVQDITERTRAVRLLRESERQLREAGEELKLERDTLEAVIENLDSGVIFCDFEGKVVSLNASALRIYGYASPAEAIGKRYGGDFDLKYADGRPMARQDWPLARALRGDFVRGYEAGLVRHGSGAAKAVSYSVAPIHDSAGAVALIVLNVTDLTERKRAEEALRHSQKLESIGLLAGGIAHDFNNLLVGVVGNASLAQELLPAGHPAMEFLANVIRTGDQAAHLTRQMLAYAGKGQFVVERLDLSALAKELRAMVQPSIPNKVGLTLQLDPDLPPVEADRGHMQQVFMNLALNAAEAIGNAPGLITVRTFARDVGEGEIRQHASHADLRPGRYVCLQVRDTGCGMDPATRARIFDPFFSTKFTGRGLGLAAVGGIVRSHKGAIHIETAPGQGSCFTVLFPAAPDSPVPRPEPSPARAAARGTGTILVVDDEEVIRTTARCALERHGYRVLTAESGASALDAFARHSAEIAGVILDLSMPGMSGVEVLPGIRAIRPDVRVIVSSGYSESEAMRVFDDQRVAGFIQKPYTSGALADAVGRAMQAAAEE